MRYFDPDLGMFISRDPIGLMGGTNTFAYAPNPTGWIDPFGLAGTTLTEAKAGSGYDYILKLDSSLYPEAAGHIRDAIKAGHTSTVTIDRPNASNQRKDSLRGCACIPGKDRDEWPMAMFEEGGTGASIRGIGRSDNRGAGSSIGHALSGLKDGTRVKFEIE